MDDLIERLRELSAYKHDDLSIGNEAADELEALQRQLGECSGGYQTLEREVEAARKRIEQLESAALGNAVEISKQMDRAERAETELADIKESYRETVNEKCNPRDDRVHCSCVPALRAELADERRRHDENLLRWKAAETELEAARKQIAQLTVDLLNTTWQDRDDDYWRKRAERAEAELEAARTKGQT
jgi:septation ring formation regulator EzrA